MVSKYKSNTSPYLLYVYFCLRQSPDHGTVDVVVVVLVVVLLGGTTLIFNFFQDTEIFIK